MQLLTCPKCHLTWYEYGDTDKSPYSKQPLVDTEITISSTDWPWTTWFDYGVATNQTTYNYLTEWK